MAYRLPSETHLFSSHSPGDAQTDPERRSDSRSHWCAHEGSHRIPKDHPMDPRPVTVALSFTPTMTAPLPRRTYPSMGGQRPCAERPLRYPAPWCGVWGPKLASATREVGLRPPRYPSINSTHTLPKKGRESPTPHAGGGPVGSRPSSFRVP